VLDIFTTEGIRDPQVRWRIQCNECCSEEEPSFPNICDFHVLTVKMENGLLLTMKMENSLLRKWSILAINFLRFGVTVT